MTMQEVRRRSAAILGESSWWTMRHVVRAWKWTLAPLCDEWHGLSLTRFIAIYVCVLVGHRAFIHDEPLTWMNFWFIVLAIATAFGKSTFELIAQHLPDKP